MSQDRWVKLDKGQFEIKEMQCETCMNKLRSPMKCKKFSDRKPSFVLKAEANCPEFEPKE